MIKKKKKKLENALWRSVHYIILLPIFAGDYYRQETTCIPRKGKAFSRSIRVIWRIQEASATTWAYTLKTAANSEQVWAHHVPGAHDTQRFLWLLSPEELLLSPDWHTLAWCLGCAGLIQPPVYINSPSRITYATSPIYFCCLGLAFTSR